MSESVNSLSPNSQEYEQPDTAILGIKVKVKKAILFYGGLFTGAGVLITAGIARYFNLDIAFRDYVALFSAGMVATTLYYHAKNLELNYKYNKERLEFDRQKYNEEKDGKLKQDEKLKIRIAYEMMSEWYKPGICENVQTARDFLVANKNKLADHLPVSGFIDELEKDKGVRKSVISILNFFEHLSLLIEKDMIDEETIKSAFLTLFCDYYKALTRFIHHHKGENKRYLSSYETVCLRWIKN